MESIANFTFEIATEILPEKKENTRQALLGELYTLYLNYVNKDYQIKNRKRFYHFIRLHYPTALSKKEEYYKHKDEFKNAKLPDHQKFLKPIASDDFLWWGRFRHLKGEEGLEQLRTVISEAKDKEYRGEDVALYILGSCGKLTVDNK